MDRRQFTLAIAGLGVQAVSGEATGCTRAVGPVDYLLPTLRRYAKWPWPQSVRAAMPLLMPLGDFVPLLIDLVTDEDAEMRLFAIDVLGELQPDVRSLPALIGALGDPDPLVRVWAASLVLEFGAKAKAAVPAFEKWLTPDESMPPHRQEWFRVTAADAMSRIDPSRTDILPVLLDALESRNPLCQLVGAEALGDLGASAALPMLRRLHQEKPGRQCFAEAIAQITAATNPRHLPGNEASSVRSNQHPAC